MLCVQAFSFVCSVVHCSMINKSMNIKYKCLQIVFSSYIQKDCSINNSGDVGNSKKECNVINSFKSQFLRYLHKIDIQFLLIFMKPHILTCSSSVYTCKLIYIHRKQMNCIAKNNCFCLHRV